MSRGPWWPCANAPKTAAIRRASQRLRLGVWGLGGGGGFGAIDPLNRLHLGCPDPTHSPPPHLRSISTSRGRPVGGALPAGPGPFIESVGRGAFFSPRERSRATEEMEEPPSRGSRPPAPARCVPPSLPAQREEAAQNLDKRKMALRLRRVPGAGARGARAAARAVPPAASVSYFFPNGKCPPPALRPPPSARPSSPPAAGEGGAPPRRLTLRPGGAAGRSRRWGTGCW